MAPKNELDSYDGYKPQTYSDSGLYLYRGSLAKEVIRIGFIYVITAVKT
jgi:hypothetical protein